MRAVTAPLSLDKTKCTTVDANALDCTAALAKASNAPAFHRVILPSNLDVSSCSLLRITTASKGTALANASGIGFYSSTVTGGNQAAEDSGMFVPGNLLKASGSATLLNGAAAKLQDFVGVTNCETAGSTPPGRVFKPYMQFETAAQKVFHNWDRGSNYLIDSSVTHFDRSADVLKP